MKKKYVVLILVVLLIIIGSYLFINPFESQTKNSNETKFSDMGISKNNSNEWFILKNVTKTVTDNGTELSSKLGSGAYANKPSTSIGWKESYDWSTPFTIEFDVVKWKGNPFIRITNEKNFTDKNFHDLHIKDGSHVKIVSNDSTTTCFVDGKITYTDNNTFTNAQIGFRLVNATVMYKNFKIY